MFEFNNLAKELTEMISSFKQLRELGLINYKFNDIVDFLNEHSGEKIFSTNTTENPKDAAIYKELTINFSQETNSISVLHQVNLLSC
jgi:hypothetical protein